MNLFSLICLLLINLIYRRVKQSSTTRHCHKTVVMPSLAVEVQVTVMMSNKVNVSVKNCPSL